MARKKELTPEEKFLREKERDMGFIKERIQNLNEPSYFFNIGDKVQYGAIEESIVDEILYDGKVYVLRTKKRAPFNGAHEEDGCAVVAWCDIRPLEYGNTTFARNQDVRLYFQSSSIESLIFKYYHFGVDMEPEYQRGYVWDESDKELLLDSIFNNIDIGKFVFISVSDERRHEIGKEYEILDGKQRLSTLIQFYENKLQYKGKYYNELSWKDRQVFKGHAVTYADVKDCDKKDILKYFLMLNRTGKVMDRKHLENVEKLLQEV